MAGYSVLVCHPEGGWRYVFTETRAASFQEQQGAAAVRNARLATLVRPRAFLKTKVRHSNMGDPAKKISDQVLLRATPRQGVG